MTAEAILLAWFDQKIEPSKTLLWASAVVPDTFRGDPKLLQEVLKRPLDAPDAMGQRRAAARYGACLIAHAIKNLNPEPAKFISLIDEFNFFQNLDTILKHSISDELRSVIVDAIEKSFDPTPIWKTQLAALTDFFCEAVEKLNSLLGTPKRRIKLPRIYSYFDTAQKWWGIAHYEEEGVLNILPPFLFLPFLSRCLLLREAVKLFFPASFRDALDVQEFANTVVTEFGDKSCSTIWSQLKWHGISLSPGQRQLIETISQLSLRLLKQDKFQKLTEKLKFIDKLVLEAPTGAFTMIAQKGLTNLSHPQKLSNVQRKVLLALVENHTNSERELAKATKFARGTISRNLDSLHTQFGLIVQGELNYRKVGLVPLLLICSQPNENKSSTLYQLGQQLDSFPFCIRLHAPKKGMRESLYAILTLPSETIPIFQDQLFKWGDHTKARTQLTAINQFDWGWNLHFWNQFSRDSWKILASSILRKNGMKECPHNFIKYQGRKEKLTREALRIIVTLENNMRISQRQLAIRAQTSLTTASKFYSQFVPNILQPNIKLSNPHIGEIAIFSVSSQSFQLEQQLLDGLQLLPTYQIWRLSQLSKNQLTNEPQVLVAAGFPPGGLIQFISVLHEILGQYDGTLSTPAVSTTLLTKKSELPFALYKTVGQEWICSPKVIETLFK